MDGAVYAIVVNVCVALLFATTFAVVRVSYPQQRAATWFSAVYLLGMLTPLSELAVRFLDHTALFLATSYGTFLLSMLTFLMGVTSLAGREQPRKILVSLLLAGIIGRAAIWNGPRNELWYELVYQAPFIAISACSAATAIAAARRTRSLMWLALAILLGVMTAYFVAKPFFAAAFGSGVSAKVYAASPYALFSQALGGILIVMAGLLILLMLVQSVLSSSIRDSETDALTGIANRRGFDRHAPRIIDAARQAGQPVAVLLFDLDHFKRVNDGYGHATGDAVLRAFAAVLTSKAPPTSLVARIGGEEFIVVLERTTLRGAWLTAQAIRADLPHLGAHHPAITVSGGIAELKAADTFETLLARADARAYHAKETGRNRICPMPEPLLGEEGVQALHNLQTPSNLSLITQLKAADHG
ncbi:diguanylate cyclase domain-containing protein [Tianweitania populi]|uniref:diguanylate cyclase n=1 Tax=Tianweitania populi TaxID=1607949 RepID=A0A8J3GL04_9HYPH|nr:GGDEF domain-containing protein [Tianweitania populi]GHD15041.1 GGDEF domain-containing protein [Tianweitania populi]